LRGRSLSDVERLLGVGRCGTHWLVLLSDLRRSYDCLASTRCGGAPATLPGFHVGRPPRNKGMRYPADPPTVEEIVAVMRHASDDRHGWRVRAVIVVLWRAGLRIQKALELAEHDLDPRRGSLLVRSGKGGRRREVGMDAWGWEQLRPWLDARRLLPRSGRCFAPSTAPPAGGRGPAQLCAAGQWAGEPRHSRPSRAEQRATCRPARSRLVHGGRLW
jgi:site-specific recombinase XerC